MNPYLYENVAWNKSNLIIGIDEAGRGCLCGPVVVACVALQQNYYNKQLIDSKQLTQKQLLDIYSLIIKNCSYSVEIGNIRQIAAKNIYQITKKLMHKSAIRLSNSLLNKGKNISLILSDAMSLDIPNIETNHFIKGESVSASIAAASIIAKVTRDSIMKTLGKALPSFCLDKHKGYGTKFHISCIQKLKASVIHRPDFIKNIKDLSHETSKDQQQLLF